jgi:4-hydroxy-tetrahydrodipicolinate synthase
MNAPNRFRGTFTALVTPFTSSDAIDFEAFDRLLHLQIAGGVQGVVLLGTTGESPTVTDSERDELTRFTVKRAKGRMLVVVGTGSNSTSVSIAHSRHAAELGADALLIVNPYYNKPTQAGLLAHFRAIADAVSVPIILYNIAGRTGINLNTDTLVQLAEHARIIGVKEASGDIPQMMNVLDRTPDDFLVLSGDDMLTFPLLALGGDGVVSVLSNLLPAEVSSMVAAAANGDWDKARQIHFRLLPMLHACLIETNPIPIKTALALRGIVREQFRLPLCPMQSHNRRTLEELLAGFDRS